MRVCAAPAAANQPQLPQCTPFTVVRGGIAVNSSSMFHGRRTATDAAADCAAARLAVPRCTGLHRLDISSERPGRPAPHLLDDAAGRTAPGPGTASCPAPAAPPAPAGPAGPAELSVLMVAIDDLRDEPGGFGGDAHTPVVDRLAA